MKVYSELEVAALENVTADPTPVATGVGRIVFDTVKKTARIQKDATTFASLGGGGLEPSATIDRTYVGTPERDDEYLVDLNGGSLTVPLPNAPGTETFKIAFNIVRIADPNTLLIQGSGGQQIYWNGTLKDDFRVNQNVRVEFAWNGTYYVAKVTELTTSVAFNNVITDGITAVGTVIENTDNTEYSVVAANVWETVKTITLTEGVWQIHGRATVLNNSAGSRFITFGIKDETAATMLPQSIIFTTTVGSERVIFPSNSVVTVPKGTTRDYGIAIRANGLDVRVDDDSISGGLTDPDNSQQLYAVKLAVAPN